MPQSGSAKTHINYHDQHFEKVTADSGTRTLTLRPLTAEWENDRSLNERDG